MQAWITPGIPESHGLAGHARDRHARCGARADGRGPGHPSDRPLGSRRACCRSCSTPTSARAPARRCSWRASSTIPTSRPSTRARIRRVGLGGAPVPHRARRARGRPRHRDHPRLRIDRASVGHGLHVRRSRRQAARHRRRADDRRRDPAARRRRRSRSRAGRGRRDLVAGPRSVRGLHRSRRSPPTRSTPTAGIAAATWACVDADGFLTITDRVNDVIIRGGENISAAEIEEAIGALPQIAEVAVVAAPDARLGEHACAVVRLAPGRRRRSSCRDLTDRARADRPGPAEVARRAAYRGRLPPHPVGQGAQSRSPTRSCAPTPADDNLIGDDDRRPVPLHQGAADRGRARRRDQRRRSGDRPGRRHASPRSAARGSSTSSSSSATRSSVPTSSSRSPAASASRWSTRS